MRLLAVAVVAIAAIAGIQVAYAQEPTPTQAPERVTVAITAASVRDTNDTRTDTLLLWNRNIRTTPIGHAVKSCIKTGTGGVLGASGVLSCFMTVSLPLGKVTASGLVHSYGRYTLVITGGTGAYEGVTGPLFVRRVADGVRRLTFTL